MTKFEVHVRTDFIESYLIEAETAEEARRKFNNGECSAAFDSEAIDYEIVGVEAAK